MTSDDEKKRTIPYVPYSTFSTALDHLASHGLPTKIDRSMFPSFSGTVQGQLIGAFGFLGLIDNEGIPQPALDSLAIAEREERNTALRKILTARYEKLFEIDLKKITPAQFDDILGEYGVTGATKTRAKSFFVKAAQEAGIEMSALLLREDSIRISEKKWFSCRFGGSDLCWRAWPMDAAAIVENAGNSGRERRLGKGCEHVQTWSGVFHNRLENASRFPRAPTGPS